MLSIDSRLGNVATLSRSLRNEEADDVDKLAQMLNDYTYDADQFQIEIERFCDVVNKDYDEFHPFYRDLESNIGSWLKVRFFGLTRFF